ncbi:MAG TPA: universal stress protein [Gemmatimonadaceae bacterium]|nr:universal stress protein [Gemmatimonadaceae bacterium]
MKVTRRRSHRDNPKRPVARERTMPPRPAPPLARPVLVATDGSKAAGAAIQFASAMADAGVWQPEALTVLEQLPVAVADVALPAQSVMIDPNIEGGLLETIRRQLREIGGGSWPLAVEFGGAARAIANLAQAHQSKLIVAGLGRHGKLARLLGAETVARVCRLTDIPVLAVDASAKAFFHSALVAMDFGDSSVRAAREALSLLQPPGRLHLLHVQWTLDGRTMHEPAWDRLYAAGVEHGFKRLHKELAPPDGVEITTELRQGPVLETILEVADKIDADLLAVGSHSQTVVDRMIIGSTTSQLLRAVHCSMLVAPPESTSRSA